MTAVCQQDYTIYFFLKSIKTFLSLKIISQNVF